MKVTTHKQPTKPSKKARSSSEVRFDKAWQRVVNQQKKNNKLREGVQAFAESVKDVIGAQEQVYARLLYQSCLHLLPFYTRKSLAHWQREALLHWLTEYIDSIRHNPFAAGLDLTPLLEQMESVMAEVHPELASMFSDEAEAMAGDEAPFFDEQDAQEAMGDLFEELAADFGDDPGFEEFAQWFNDQQEFMGFDQPQQDEALALEKLMKGSSLNKLFRKVARVLHPDREQDEQARVEKTRLMSELVEARDSNDLITIFALYTQYVGESPLQELGGDLENATLLLQRQFYQLRGQEDDIIHEDPVAGILYKRFYGKSKKSTLQNLERHREELEERVASLQALCIRVTSVNKLKPYLEERWEYMNRDYPFEFD